MFWIILFRENENYRWKASASFNRTYTDPSVARTDLEYARETEYKAKDGYEVKLFEVRDE